MRKSWILIMVQMLIVCGCGNSFHVRPASSEDLNNELNIKVGWKTPIVVTGKQSEQYQQPLGGANSAIEGLTLQQVVQDANVSVRADNFSCVDCHGGAGTSRPEWDAGSLTREQFCGQSLNFLAADKPEVIKAVIVAWWITGCP